MEYLIKSGRFYFVGFDEGWPTWMLIEASSKRYTSEKEAQVDREKLIKFGIKDNIEIIKYESIP